MPNLATTTISFRRFRFGLRTLFVLVTVVSIWFGYSMNWIRQRRELLRNDSGARRSVFVPRDPDVRAPAGLWMFGEKGVNQLLIGETDLEQARRLFPEAEVIRWENPLPFGLDP